MAIFALKVGKIKLDPAVLRAAQSCFSFMSASNKLLHLLSHNLKANSDNITSTALQTEYKSSQNFRKLASPDCRYTASFIVP